MKYGVTSLFYGFLNELNNNQGHIAPLMVTGKLEDYLCKEFSAYIHRESRGKRIAYSNLGNQGQRKYDLAIVNNKREIKAIFEAKYLGNRHRDTTFSAEDNIATTIKTLAKQCAPPSIETHASSDLKLTSKLNSVYGLVFCGFTSMDTADYYDNQKKFYKKCIDAGNTKGFRYHDLAASALRPAFEDVPFNSLGNEWYSSLKVGLWRID